MKKMFTGLSIALFALSFFMIIYLFLDWELVFFERLYEINMFTPLLMSILGVISACLSLKGTARKILILLNSLLFIYFGLLSLIALFGFQEP